MLVRTTDLSKSARSEGRVYISKESYQFLSNSNLFGGEIVLPNIGSIGDAYVVPSSLYPKMSLAPNAITFSTFFCDKYYYYYFLSKIGNKQLMDISESTAMPKFNKTDLRQLKVLCPPLFEQQRIADFLDRKCADIDNVLEKTKASIEEYRRLKQSVITEAVTKGVRGPRSMKDSGIEWIGEIPEEWIVSPLGKLFRLQRGYDLPQDKFIKGSYPVCGSNGIIGYHSVMTTPKPCITIGRSGSVGKVNFYGQDTWVHNTAIFVKDCFGSEPKYIYYVLLSLNMDYMSTKTAVPTLDRKNIQRFQFSYTKNLQEQHEIASYLDQKCSEIDSLIESKERFIKELEAYRKSLIYEYVTGKKDVFA